MSISVCNVCSMVETRVGSYDGPEYCNDCYSVEQGFIEIVDEVNINGVDFTVDEENNLYIENEECNGVVGSLL